MSRSSAQAQRRAAPAIGHSRNFHTIDGIRGMAAFAVVGRHVGSLGVRLPESFLAVDMFFLLSGFVIAYAYDAKLASGTFTTRFALIRLVRLYPLYILGIALGVVAHLIGAPGTEPLPLAIAIPVSLLMIPKLPGVPVGCSALDGPTWTLPLELLANIAYAIGYRLFSPRTLAVIVLLCAAGLIVTGVHAGSLDHGWQVRDVPIGLCRLGFSFFGGVLIFRRLGDRRRSRPAVAWLCVALVALLLCLPVPARAAVIYELVLVLLVFPVILIAACQSEPGAVGQRMFRLLGLVSYAVYTLHAPVSYLLLAALGSGGIVLTGPMAAFAPAAYLVLITAVAWLADRWFDVPVRRWLGRRLGLVRGTEPAAMPLHATGS